MKEPSGERTRQLPIEFGVEPAYSSDDLIVTPANAQAAALVRDWPQWPSPVVILAGPPGAGKSHLAAIWQSRSQAGRFEPGAIGAPELPASGAALVEDADAGVLDEQGLFHLINAVRAAGGSLLITARGFPGAWNATLPDLLSRLKAATTVEIGEPDDMLLAAVITKLFADRQLAVDKQVVRYLVNRMDRSLATAIELVGMIDRASLEMKKPVTRALAAEVLAQRPGSE